MQDKRTALIFAAMRDLPECTRLLVDGGADLEVRGSVRLFAFCLINASKLMCDCDRMLEYEHANLVVYVESDGVKFLLETFAGKLYCSDSRC